jgi:hypothetical protein
MSTRQHTLSPNRVVLQARLSPMGMVGCCSTRRTTTRRVGVKGIASRFNTDAATLLDFNVSTIDGLSVKAKLHSGTAVQVRCPARGDGAQGVPDLPDVGAG